MNRIGLFVCLLLCYYLPGFLVCVNFIEFHLLFARFFVIFVFGEVKRLRNSLLTLFEANLSFLLSRVIGSHFKKALNVAEKCFGRR